MVSSAPTETTTTTQTAPTLSDVRQAALLGMLDALARVLSARALLMLAVLGAFVLAVMASTILGAVVLGVFCGLTVLPLVVLDYIQRPGG